MGLAVGSAVGVAVGVAVGLEKTVGDAAGVDGTTAPGDPAGPAFDSSRFAQAVPSTTAASARAPSRIHHRLDIDRSVRAAARSDPGRARGGHDVRMGMTAAERRFLGGQRRVVLVTIAPDGRPRPVPICFVLALDAPVLYTPLDDKPKRTDDPRALARVRDIARDTHVAILADRWDEDWTHLAWLRAEGRAALLEPGPEHADAVAELRATYPQYAAHRLDDRPLIRIEIARVTSWGALD